MEVAERKKEKNFKGENNKKNLFEKWNKILKSGNLVTDLLDLRKPDPQPTLPKAKSYFKKV